MGMTTAQAAEIVGVSRQAIEKRIKAGTLRVLADGSLDPRDVDSARRGHDPYRAQVAKMGAGQRKKREERAKPAPKADPNAPRPVPIVRAGAPGPDTPLSPYMAKCNAARSRWRRRLERAYQLGFRPGIVPIDAVQWLLIELASRARDSLEWHVEQLGALAGYPPDTRDRILAKPMKFLSDCSVAFLEGEDELIRVDVAHPFWRRGPRPTGPAAMAWDAARKKRRRGRKRPA